MPEGWRTVGQFTRELALAVQVTDALSGGRAIGDPSVRVEDVDEEPIRNQSGYYLFFELPEEEVTVAVEGGDYYWDGTTTVDLDPGSSDPHDMGEAAEVVLEPTPAYPFPSGLTRVRGTVFDGTTKVAGADISVDGFSRTTRTTDSGEFVYYFDDIDRDDIEVDSGTGDRLYRPGNTDPEFEVDGGPGTLTESVRVVIGQLTTQDLHY